MTEKPINMSYAVSMDASEVDCKIPVGDLKNLAKRFEEVKVNKKTVSLNEQWEEDESPITGKIVGDVIILDSEQGGTYKNSSDGGLAYLLITYKGSGIITEDGEDGDDHTVTKYTKGVAKEGRVVFDDDSEDDDEPDDLDDELSLMEDSEGDDDEETHEEEDEKPIKTVKVNKDRFSDLF